MAKRQPLLVIGNWKMNPSSLALAKRLFVEIRTAVVRKKMSATVAISAPSLYIADLARLSPSGRVQLGAQDVSAETEGAHTGEISVGMLKTLGVSSIIIGHSERRAAGETDDLVSKKLTAVLSAGLTAVLCIGEAKRDTHGTHFSVVEAQLRHALAAVKKNHIARLVIAYEPIWAIGTGKNATAEDVEEMKLFIQRILSDLFGRTVAAKVRILYGGSVNAKNASDLLAGSNVDGFLVGGASLKAPEFVTIVEAAHRYGKN